jgi:hypothetical protein
MRSKFKPKRIGTVRAKARSQLRRMTMHIFARRRIFDMVLLHTLEPMLSRMPEMQKGTIRMGTEYAGSMKWMSISDFDCHNCRCSQSCRHLRRCYLCHPWETFSGGKPSELAQRLA